MGRLNSNTLTHFAGELRSRLLSRRAFAGTATGAAFASVCGRHMASAQSQGNQEIVPVTDRVNRYFAETGHNLEGSVPWSLGTKRRRRDFRPSDLGGAVRYRLRRGPAVVPGVTLVYDPTLQSPWDVQGQHLGSQIHADQAPRSARTRVTGARAARLPARTFQRVVTRSAAGWHRSGTSEAASRSSATRSPEAFEDEESGDTVQVFEKAVVEDAGGGNMSLRPMGEAKAEAEGMLTDLAFLPAPPTGGTTFSSTHPMACVFEWRRVWRPRSGGGPGQR